MRLIFPSLLALAVAAATAFADQAEPAREPAAAQAAGGGVGVDGEAPVLGGRGAPVVPPADAAPTTPMLPTAADPNNLTPAESMAWRDLRDAVLRERAIWERLRARPDDDLEQQRAQAEFRTVMNAYENVIRAAPKFAEAYAAYGLLLSRTGNREEAVRAFLKANQLDPNMPMVKNQIGNYLIEEGRYKYALGYYLAAIKLKPDEPLYHYQLGSLLREYRQFLVTDGLYTSGKIDKLMQEAFREAARLAPDNWGYIYRFAESYYDLETPKWDEALAEWTRLEEKAQPGVEKQTIHLHRANVLARMGRRDEARLIVDSIVEPSLLGAKAEVLAMLDPPPAEEVPAPAASAPVEQGKEPVTEAQATP
jgi:tetratricopeptide (TPR) repeat protein